MYLKQKLLLDFISLGPRTSTFIMDDVPAPSTKLNPILLPESPSLGKHIREIIGSPPSSIEPLSSHTREAVLRRIRELEDTPGILTPAATNRAMLAGPSHNTGDESVQRPHAILALEDWASRRQQGSAHASHRPTCTQEHRRLGKDNDYDSGKIVDRGVYFSSDGQRRTEELLNVRHKKRKLGPSGLKDVWAEWVPMPMATSRRMLLRLLQGVRKHSGSYVSIPTHEGIFVDKLLCHEGLGNDQHLPHCALCEAAFEPSSGLPASLQTPLHTIQEWNGSFWVNSTLASLGLIYQIGHGGFPCPFPDDAVRNMTVIAAPIIHQIRFQYCKCDKSDDADNLEQLMRNAWYPATVTDPGTCATFQSLEAYRMYNVVGNLNVRDFIAALQRVTDTTVSSGMTWLPERYKQFQRMARQWRREDQIGSMRGQCWLVRTWVQSARKLVRGRSEVSILYMLIIAVDTNFRLKNHMRANEIDDPSLGPGWGYWVDPERSRVWGVAYVHAMSACSPMGSGTSRRARGFTLLLLMISYAIACQWKANLHPRMEKLPADIHIPLNSIKLQCTLPVWHAASHVEDCQNQNSLTFQEGVGKTDGKGVERTWSRLNPAAYSTKDAGLGQQVNKTVSREVRASWEGMIEAWVKDDTSTVANLFVLERERYASEIASGWMILMMDPLTDCPTEAEVRLDVRKDEDALNTVGKTPLHGCSAMAFLTMGIQIEDSQRRIIVQLAGTVLVAADCETKIQEWWHALLAKLVKFRNLQAIYMPGAAATIAEAEEAHDAATSPPKPELVQLFMPSDLAALGLADALVACVLGLVEMEAKLCVGQCDNSLASLRSRLHAKRWLIGFCNENVTGQIQATKLGEQVEGYAKRYRKGHSALRALKGKVIHPHLRLLRLEDVQLDGDNEESDAAS
ncbi:hypothetical protein B0H13DRAFT_1890747 [Mycena leptocephala]|nr:hypothetical protein B0H13DRAFT_1890747 [Mycena leptocephala]